MEFCTNCGKQLPEEAKFCEHCGAPVLSAVSIQQESLDNAQKPGVIPLQGGMDNTTESAEPIRQGSLIDMQETTPQVQQIGSGYTSDTPSKGTVPEGTLPKPKKKPIGAIILGLIAMATAVFFLRPSGWSTEDAQNFTQAYLEYCFFRGDDETLAKYMEDTTVEELSDLREEKRDELIESGLFESDVPVTDELKTRYADFYIDLMKNARFTVGEAVKAEDGFEVPVSIEPITSLSEGDFVLLDLQLNDDLSREQLNERVYSRELELMKDLARNLSYGEEIDFVMHISRMEDGTYDISQNDLKEIMNASWVKDRHWSENRARGAVEAVLGGVFQEKYAEMSEWTVATEEEIESTLSLFYSKDTMRDAINESGAEIISDAGREDSYSVSESVVEKISSALKKMVAGTKYEVIDIEGDQDEYVANVRITPYSISMDGIEKEVEDRLAQEIDSISEITVFIDRIYELMAELIAEHIEEEEYGDPSIYQIHLKFNNNNAYEIDTDEIYSLFDVYGISDYAKEAETDAEKEKASSEDEKAESADGGEEKKDEKEDNENSTSSGSPFADEEDKTEDSSASASVRKTYASGKEIPLLVRGKEIVLGETTVEEFLDETGLTIDESADTLKAEDYEEIEIETGDEDTYLSLMIKKDASTKEIKECSIYEVTYSDYSSNKRQNALVFFGGLTVGSTPDDVREVFGKSDYDDEDSVSYYMDDDTYSLYFAHEDGIVEYMSFERMFY